MDKIKSGFDEYASKEGRTIDAAKKIKALRARLEKEWEEKGKEKHDRGPIVISGQGFLGAQEQFDNTKNLLSGFYEKEDSETGETDAIGILNGNLHRGTDEEYPNADDIPERWKNNRGHPAAPESRYVKEYCNARGIKDLYLCETHNEGFYAGRLYLCEPRGEEYTKVLVKDL